ncbi:MAG TPA: alpha/beta hydrolase [Acidimicrobiales bacterium]|nr:alpha/beta hydrolase [Acidimicrobiales bacterium]
MKERVNLSGWTSPQAEHRFRDLEDRLVSELVAQPPTPIDVATRLGRTRAYRWDGRGEPIVFLHGTGGTGLMWAAYASHRGDRAMYAIDTIGDVGRSHQEVAVDCAEDLADWLGETLDALGLDRVHLAGTSYGGYLALNFAVHRPTRVRSLVLVDTGGIVRVRRLTFMLWGVAALVASWLPGPPRRLAAKTLRTPMLEDKRLLRLALYGQVHHRTRLLRPEPLSDDRLGSIEQPVLLILGAKSEVFPAAEVRARAETLLRRVEFDAVPGAGHAVALSHVERITGRMAAFLGSQDDGARGSAGVR